MKRIYLVLSFLVMLGSCTNKKITDFRGKVKYENLNLSSKIPGIVSKIFVKEGDAVHKGDTLIILNVDELSAKRMQAEGAVKAARAQLQMAYNGATIEQVKQIDGKLEAVQSQYNFAKESFERIKNMYKDSLIPKQKYDEVKMKFRMAEAQLKAVQAKKKEVLKGTRNEIISQAQGQLKRALGALKEVEIAEQNRYIIAPENFVVDKISIHKGELAPSGYTLINGWIPQSIYFRFTIPEHKINNFKIHQKIEIENPFINKNITTEIVRVKTLPKYANITAPEPAYKLGETMYELKLIPTDKISLDKWKKNMTVLIKNIKNE